jgi:hypothetical protein
MVFKKLIEVSYRTLVECRSSHFLFLNIIMLMNINSLTLTGTFALSICEFLFLVIFIKNRN